MRTIVALCLFMFALVFSGCDNITNGNGEDITTVTVQGTVSNENGLYVANGPQSKAVTVDVRHCSLDLWISIPDFTQNANGSIIIPAQLNITGWEYRAVCEKKR